MDYINPEDNNGRLKYFRMYGVIIWCIVFCIAIVFIVFKQRLLGYNSVNQESPDNQIDNQESHESSRQEGQEEQGSLELDEIKKQNQYEKQDKKSIKNSLR